MEAEPRLRKTVGVTDRKATAAAAAAAAEKKTIQVRCYFYGYTWSEVLRDPLVLLLTALHLYMIWNFFSAVDELTPETVAGILLFLFLLLPMMVLMSMLPFFIGFEDVE